jgi:hypothetical protein
MTDAPKKTRVDPADDEMVNGLIDRVYDLVNAISPYLAGEPPGIIGSVLVDLTATWLAGHVVHDQDPMATRDLREELLAMHVAAVRALLPIQEKKLDLKR